MKAMAYIKKTACDDLSLKDFQEQWKACSPADQDTLREWAVAEGQVLGIEVEAK